MVLKCTFKIRTFYSRKNILCNYTLKVFQYILWCIRIVFSYLKISKDFYGLFMGLFCIPGSSSRQIVKWKHVREIRIVVASATVGVTAEGERSWRCSSYFEQRCACITASHASHSAVEVVRFKYRTIVSVNYMLITLEKSKLKKMLFLAVSVLFIFRGQLFF